jgi:2-methylcitrate dehydratase PrpD
MTGERTSPGDLVTTQQASNKEESMTYGTSDLAEFALYSKEADFPERARQMAVDAMTDCLGCMIAGAREPLAAKLFNVIGGTTATDGKPKGPLLGTGMEAPAHDAALYNGALAHAIDYDDTTHPAYAHPSAVLLPVMLALARHTGARGADVVSAYITGIEVFGKLGRALNTAHYRNGWHATATFGTMAAATAASRLLRLSTTQCHMALGMAASAASGIRANFGTMTKPLHAGYAARNGVLAALLGREDFTACPTVLAHKDGYPNVFNHHENIEASYLQRWGEPLEILTEYGLGLKPYPACGATHPAIEAAILLHARLNGEVAGIKEVRVGVTDMHFEPLIYEAASSGLEGKFCMAYCIAAALKDGAVTLETFTERTLQAVAATGLMAKVRMELDDRVAGNTEFGAVVSVTTVDGRTLEELVPLAMGKPSRWFTKERLESKFRDCCKGSLDAATTAEIFALAQGLDSAPTLEPLIVCLLRAFSADRRKAAAE